MRASGGPDVAPFETSLDSPEPIQPSFDYRPGTVFDPAEPLEVRWEGGDVASFMEVLLESRGANGELRDRYRTLVDSLWGDATLKPTCRECPSSGTSCQGQECRWGVHVDTAGSLNLILRQRLDSEDLGPPLRLKLPTAPEDIRAGGWHGWHLYEYEWEWKDLKVSKPTGLGN